MAVAALSMFAYDCALTMGMEVDLIWKKKPWTAVKVIYFVQRYIPILDGGILPLYRESPSTDSDYYSIV